MLDDKIQGEEASEPSLTGKKKKEKKLKYQALIFHQNQGRKLLIEQSVGNTLSKEKMILHNATVVTVV